MTTTSDQPGTSMPNTASWTPINIAAPLPLDVASTLTALIGSAYPSAVIDTRGNSGGYALAMRIDPGERRHVSKKIAATAKTHVDDEMDQMGLAETSLHGIESDDTSTWVSLAAPEELGLFLGQIADRMFTETEGAINYVEWQVQTLATEEDLPRRYILTVSKSKERTPSALREKAEIAREKAEARAVAAETTLGRVRALLDVWETSADAGPCADELRQALAGE